MGLAANQARLNVLTAQKADLEYRLMMLTSQSQKLAAEKSEEISQKANAQERYTQLKAENAEDTTVSFLETAAYADYEKAMAELEAADLKLTQQQKSVETQYQAVEAEQDEIKKLVESNIKKSFGYFN